ncbi:Succinate dehydrogenase assembly factor 2 mitochondrial [Diaporthe australafricana]|uniref:Succinate dehydrogenase assembly factor 2, mitochondrial n=1 Tax=Diaporthe australafricana TaxID=127596 RepID=A0ABR3XI29_9PEZI
MMFTQRALCSASRRILAARPVVAATAVQARWQHNSGPFDPVAGHEMGVGELEGAKFRIEPLRRTGEDAETMRARLTYQSRKRGTLESDLLLSTFAATYLPRMMPEQMQQYDRFLDENDWDIYYWATQTEDQAATANTPAAGLQSSEPYLGDQGGAAAPAASSIASSSNKGGDGKEKMEPASPAKGEWAQTIGTFKPAFRPVPARWRGSEILDLLRRHVKERSAAGVLGNNDRDRAEGMAFMPALGERK